MNVIKKLPSIIIDQIAAGEVIEGPFSVVKELIENSIDAYSSEISIMIYGGGIDKIHIVDNGNGMSEDDLQNAFNRHATSKIINIEDLNNINTLGFRGEALPSIAAVSQLKASSIYKDDDNEGAEVIIHGGEMLKKRKKVGNKGTSIEVSNLFYNIPARKKFLKTVNTEKRKIIKLVKEYSIANPNIAFTFYSDDKEILKLTSSDLKNRIIDIYGSSISNNMISIQNTKDAYEIYGYIGNLNTVKKSKGNQYIYINGRSVTSRLLSSAAFSAYQSLVSRGEFPFFAIFINMPNELLDVNVHPAKYEVRFSNEWQLYHLIKSSFSESLKDVMSVIPSMYNKDIKPKDNIVYPENRVLPFPPNLSSSPSSFTPTSEQVDIEKVNDRLKSLPTPNSDNEGKIIWQIHNKYLITEINSGIVIIDQHVAHERILYEQAKAAIDGRGLPSQKLLFPETIKFSSEEYLLLPDIIPYLSKIGFEIREFGQDTIIVEGIPSDMEVGKEINVIKEIIEKYSHSKEINSSFIEYMTSTYACKASVKAGDKLSPHERRFLVDKLFATEHPYFCPHGRPVIINLSIDELDKRFERK
tara:strand:+ start:2215 stop:3963 length:1749 start_codon:yes stop_codon:yes gene_type:complete